MTSLRRQASPALRQSVAAALRAFHKGATGRDALADLLVVRQAMPAGGSGQRASNQVLLQALDTLEVDNPLGAKVLRQRYVEGRMAQHVALALNIAEPTLYKYQRDALSHLAGIVHELEEAARAQRLAVADEHLPPPGYTNLVGVTGRIGELLDRMLAPGPPWLYALEGMGGLGKTAWAHALMRQALRQDPIVGVGWVSAQQQRYDLGGAIRAVTSPTLTAEALMESLAAQLLPELPRPLAPERTIAALNGYLSDVPHLVVVDNLETVPDVEALLPTLRRLANPSKFILTSRQSLYQEGDVFHYAVPELRRPEALQLVRQEATLRNLPQLAALGDEELRPIVDAVGGNPLALRLVVGQTHVYSLPTILDNLAAARGATVENLYTYIYRQAWDALDETSRTAFVAMPLVPERGGSLEDLALISGLDSRDLDRALSWLVSLNLVDSRGDLQARRFAIHNLTRSFLHQQVVRWQA